MVNRLINKIAKEVVYKAHKCPYCGRTVPNFSYLTKNQCLWCDSRYWQQKLAILD